jgi:uncharacterized membrane protein
VGKTAMLGITLVLLGVVSLVIGHFSYTETRRVPTAGPLQVNSQEEPHVFLPTIGGTALLWVGAGLVIAGRKSA